MATKRMFAKNIIETDEFMDMPMPTKALYFLLGMEADDEGFVSPKRVMRIYGGNEDDLKVLIAKEFVIQFDSGVIVITDWLENNYLDKNRIKDTKYQAEKKLLGLSNNKYNLLNKGLTNVKPMLNQYSIEEYSIEERRGEEKSTSQKYNSISYLKELPDIVEYLERFNCSEKEVRSKGESLKLYCEANGKRYKNYKAFMLNAMKKDFKERLPQDLEIAERVRLTRMKEEGVSNFAKELSNKFKI